MRAALAILLFITNVTAGTFLVAAGATADAVPPGSAKDIRERLTPYGVLCKAADPCGAAAGPAAGTGLKGDAIYGKYCVACHAAGVSGAPKLGSRADWGPRIAKGLDGLFASGINGKAPGMPARGTCTDCTDAEVKTAVKFMVDKAK